MRTRPIVRAILAVFVASAAIVPRVSAQNDRRPTHVRSTEQQVVDVVRDGYDRSPTFRKLVDDLDASDVIVYVQPAAQLPAAVDAHVRFAGATVANRYLRITISAKLRGDAFIALIAHELQHAGEVARAALVRNDATLEALYRTIGDANGEGWDTAAACGVGQQVREELRRARPVGHDQ